MLPKGHKHISWATPFTRMAVTVAFILQTIAPTFVLAQETVIKGNGFDTKVTPDTGDVSRTITGGTPKGGNLFHSFSDFSVKSGDTANFLNNHAKNFNNILSRVTDNPSKIFGTIKTN